MRTKVYLSLLILSTFLIASFFPLQAHAGSAWNIQTLSTSALSYAGIALDSNNFPHLAYTKYDPTWRQYPYGHGRDFVIYTSWNGYVWINQTIANDSALCDLALDSKGNAHILYKALPGQGLSYAYWTGYDWSRKIIDTEGFEGSLALDSADNPHVAYFASGGITRSFLLKYASWTGSSWSTSTILVGDLTARPFLKLDSENNPHIMYETNKVTPTLNYITFSNASGWTMKTVGNNIEFTNMVLDSNGYPHFSHQSEEGLTYTSWNGTAWDNQPVKINAASESSLTLDKQNKPHIEFFSETLKYARWTGKAWDIQSVDSNLFFTVGPIVLDSEGNPHMCYYTYGSNIGEAPYNLMYATSTEFTQVGNAPFLIEPFIVILVIVVILVVAFVYGKNRKQKKQLF